MNRIRSSLVLFFALTIVSFQCTKSRLRLRENLVTSIIDLKSEITDIILDELMEHFNKQSFQLYQLEQEIHLIKNLSLPSMKKKRRSNRFIYQIIAQQQILAKNLSQTQEQLARFISTVHYLFPNSDSDDFPIDCDDVIRRNRNVQNDRGIFRIRPRLSSKPFDVLCLFEQPSIGWTVIQQRINGSVNFYRGWNEYRNGFGDLQTEFWLGNEQIYQLTNQDRYSLRIDLQPWTDSIQLAHYGHFALSNETNHYKLNISDYDVQISTVSDALSSSWDNANEVPFSTYDRDHDRLFYDNCASIYQGAWWFTSCFQSHLNGLYIRSPLALENTARNGLHWNTYALYHSMKETRMRIRRI